MSNGPDPISIMSLYDVPRIARVFDELREIVERETLILTAERVVVIDRYNERVWPLYAKLGKLIYNGVMIGDAPLRSAYDKMLWALIAQEFIVDENNNIGWLNGAKWTEAVASFEELMEPP